MREVRVWSDDDQELVVQLSLRGREDPSFLVTRKPVQWVEFTISRQAVGSEGFTLDAVAEGIVTPTAHEYATLGMWDGPLLTLFAALRRAYAEGRELLEGDHA